MPLSLDSSSALRGCFQLRNQGFTPDLLSMVSDDKCYDPNKFFYFVVDAIIPDRDAKESSEKTDAPFVICEIQVGMQSLTPKHIKWKLIDDLRARFGDKGPSASWNVRICLSGENLSEAHLGKIRSPETCQKISKRMIGNKNWMHMRRNENGQFEITSL